MCRIYKKLAPNPSSSRFDVTTEEAVGAKSSIYSLDYNDSILHCNASPSGATSRSSASSPKLVNISNGPTRNVMEPPDCSQTAVSSIGQQEHVPMQTCVKMETGTLTSPLCPYPAPDSMDTLMAQLMDADIRRGRPRFAASELGTSAGVHPHELVRDDRAGVSNLMMSTSLDRLLKASMRSSPLTLHDDLLPVPSSSSSFFPMNQFGWNFDEPSWLPSSSTLPSVLQVQGLQHHFQ